MTTLAPRSRPQPKDDRAAQAAAAAALIFGAQASIFTGRAKVTPAALEFGISEMIRRVYATVPGVAGMSRERPQIRVTFIGQTACARYEWSRDAKGRLSVSGVINLPATGEPGNLIPRSVADQYTGYALHELAHFLYTPIDAFAAAIVDLALAHKVSQDFAKSIVNGLEDVCIERNLIQSGHAPGAGAMLRGLLEKCIGEVPAQAYGSVKAFPVTLCFGLRGYTPAARPLVAALPQPLRAIYDTAARAMAALPPRVIGDRDCIEGVRAAADEVLRALAALRDAQPPVTPPPVEPGEPGEGEPGEGEPGEGEPGEGEPGEGSDDDGEGSDDDGEGSDDDGEGSDDDGEGSDDDGEGSDDDGEGSDDDGDDMGQPGDAKRPPVIDDPLPPPVEGTTPDAPEDDGDGDDEGDGEGSENEPSKDEGSDDEGSPLDTDSLTDGEQLDGDMQPEPAGDAGSGASGLDNDAIRTVTAQDTPDGGYRAASADAIRADVAKALSSAARVAHGLRLLLDTSARDSREGGRKSGRLDMSALARIAVGAESVFEKRSFQDGTDAAVSILIDQSVSMNAHGRYRAARTMAGALAKIVSGCAGVRCEILGFHSGQGQGAGGSPVESIIDEVGTAEDREDWYATRFDCCITIYKTFSESLAKGLARLGNCYGSGGTPDAASLRYAASRLAKENAGRKFLLVIADGEGSSAEVLGRILKRIERDGITAIGIGIQQSMNEAYTHRAIVNDVSKLNESGLGALLAVLSRGEVAQALRNGAD